MRRILFMLMMAVVSLSSYADEPARISLNAGVFAPYTLDATVAYEKPVGFGNAITIFGEIGDHWQTPVCHMFWKRYFWDGGLEYKHRLKSFKNADFRIFSGAYCGAHIKRFFFGFHIGFEYNYTFANNWQFTVSEKNNFNFLHGDNFLNGLMIGVKIPI